MFTFIFDIGKTNIKGQVLNSSGEVVWTRSTANQSVTGEHYLQFDIDNIWQWLQTTLKAAAAEFSFNAINISTHGACAVLVDAHGNPALPVLDYEYEQLDNDCAEYDASRPDFAETLSPGLSQGLNLGRQLWWLQKKFPHEFSRTTTILLYPQYWAYKLTGIASAEVTSLGCHTDLWQPERSDYSSLAIDLGYDRLFPPLVAAQKPLGKVSQEIAARLGLDPGCEVFPGVHDSNASFARHLYAGKRGQFTVISTGTWIISMCNDGDINRLEERRDMLANVNVLGQPIACARYMGGREFDEIARRGGQDTEQEITAAALQALIDERAFALPPFEAGSGPFRNARRQGQLTGGEGGVNPGTLYTAMMIDYELDLLGATGDVIFGGIANKSPLLCAILAQLRPAQAFYACEDVASTIVGAWCLTRWTTPAPAALATYSQITPANFASLDVYRNEWRKRVEAAN